jgi:antitoxin HicB
MIPLEDILKRNYRFEVTEDKEGDSTQWAVFFPDLDGCDSYGETMEEAITEALRLKKFWLQSLYKLGKPIPEPTNPRVKEYSGKFLIRTSPKLHERLVMLADEQGVSLNQFVIESLSRETEPKKREFNVSYNFNQMNTNNYWMQRSNEENGIKRRWEPELFSVKG